MRRSTPRKAVKPLRKPEYFPPERLLTRVLPPELVGEREFEQYHFIGFDFSQATLAGRLFSECRFENCNLAGASLAGTSLQNVAFEGCKLLGLQFEACRDMLFGVHFDKCQLDYASFSGRVMPTTRFVDCSLREANFTQTDLTNAVFERCELDRAVFHRTQLTGADFRTAYNMLLDPEVNELQQARFVLSSLPGLLTKHGLIVE
ncbi:pentapeptide repeat-containing protein [Hymenobacter sp. HSC-4F20]|uniref:pentapeptide repeat-containing protein n=1 Tax=Hymenobacter sp. HSC-4F20 TaxID=2864135 RepID=UPI001C73D928|nr:pentapeptide repeat-containing protein [Hymenobacter sp. HSC-4F20]MBX0291915.1 pentapeptide repeat-containing protein [Hymenobacter sp. HSC-4F20]